jgi:hypothetical protein
MRLGKLLAWALVVLLAGAAPSVAVPVNPFPDFGPDDGSEYFTPNSLVSVLEFWEFGNLPGAGIASTFGFFFEGADLGDSSNLIPIFDPGDLGPFPGPLGAIPQFASINFATGVVMDLDAGTVQSTFTGSGNVGFYYGMQFLGANPLFLIMFSANEFNPGGHDSMGSFPSLTDPAGYLLAFEDPGSGTAVSYHIVQGMTSAAAVVPEPGALGLLGASLLGLARWRRREG